MPEGPEIRIAADRLQAALADSLASEIYFQFDHLKRFQTKLSHRRITLVEARGKAILTHFDCGLAIYSHNQLYGRWTICRSHETPQSKRQLRLAIRTDLKSALLYSATDIEVLTPKQITAHRYLSALGPDVLPEGIEPIRAQLQSSAYRRRRFGSLFLDQHFIAGIGNYLRSEILFVAGLHPQMRPLDCSASMLDRLADAIVAISRQSYRHGGVTNDLDDAAALKAQGKTRNQYRHWVFARGNEPCRRCDTRIVEDTAASRRIYFCPVCQPLLTEAF